MTLENLRGIGRLHPHEVTAAEIRRLLVSAEAALADARRAQNPNFRIDGVESGYWT
jgi:hypothetical protein